MGIQREQVHRHDNRAGNIGIEPYQIQKQNTPGRLALQFR